MANTGYWRQEFFDRQCVVSWPTRRKSISDHGSYPQSETFGFGTTPSQLAFFIRDNFQMYTAVYFNTDM